MFSGRSRGATLGREILNQTHSYYFFGVTGVTPDAVRVRPSSPDLSGAALIHVAQEEDVVMRTYDLSPFWRSTVGFDRLLDLVNDTMNDSDNYPLYDIERTGEDQYQISLALAGFSPEEITITAEQSMLTVEGRKVNKGDHNYLYQGISMRPFRRVFNLADYVQVKDATFDDGMLKIALVRELPEAMKPRRIAIEAAGNDNQQIEQKQAA
jgi:molecular chaperone IbpA